jgi:hypothetical protein
MTVLLWRNASPNVRPQQRAMQSIFIQILVGAITSTELARLLRVNTMVRLPTRRLGQRKLHRQRRRQMRRQQIRVSALARVADIGSILSVGRPILGQMTALSVSSARPRLRHLRQRRHARAKSPPGDGYALMVILPTKEVVAARLAPVGKIGEVQGGVGHMRMHQYNVKQGLHQKTLMIQFTLDAARHAHMHHHRVPVQLVQGTHGMVRAVRLRQRKLRRQRRRQMRRQWHVPIQHHLMLVQLQLVQVMHGQVPAVRHVQMEMQSCAV